MGQVVPMRRDPLQVAEVARCGLRWPLGLPSVEARQFAAAEALADAMKVSGDVCRGHLGACLSAIAAGDVEPYRQPAWWQEAARTGQLFDAGEHIGLSASWVAAVAARFLAGRIVC